MNGHGEQVTKWFYRGLWGVLTRWFRVPKEPPTLPKFAEETIEAFKPAEAYLRYLKLQFWILLVLIDGLLFVGWIVITVVSPFAGLLLALPVLIIAVVPGIVAFLAIHLRYDTTWYVMSERSLRIRRGIWVIHETTITFENVQNVTVTQGPLQRFFGIANVLVETAGGGGGADAHHGKPGAQSAGAHRGLIEGVADAPRIRDLLMQRLGQSRSAGLGDEGLPATAAESPAWTQEHLSVLTEIRDASHLLVQKSAINLADGTDGRSDDVSD